MTEAASADGEQRGASGQAGPRDVAAGLVRPTGLRAVSGRGHVTLDWDPVPGAAGYLVYRAAGEPYEPLDHGGGDVLAVPAGPYADTTGEPGRVRHYAVAAVADRTSAGPLSDAVAAAPAAADGGEARPTVTIRVSGAAGAGELERPWQPMIGSEHLSYLLSRDRSGGWVVGAELREALRIAHDELGVRAVRAHGILDDDLGVYTESGGCAVHDLLSRLGESRLAVEVSGDGAGGLVEALAARHEDGRIGILAWNVTLDQGKIGGDPLLDRRVQIVVSVPPGAAFTVRQHRIDAGHSNIVPAWEQMRGGARWPSEGQWAELRERNTLDELGPPERVTAAGSGVLELGFDLPMPGVSGLELIPA